MKNKNNKKTNNKQEQERRVIAEKMDIKAMEHYLFFVDKILSDILYSKSIFQDFMKALREQNAKNNPFVQWVKDNYHKELILNLTKLLEPKSIFKNKRTLHHLIHSMKLQENYDLLQESLSNATIELHNTRTGEIEIEDVSKLSLNEFSEIDFDKDLNFISEIHSKLKNYRNKKLVHNDITQLEKYVLPSIDQLHGYVDELEEIFMRYFHVFRISVNNNNLKAPNYYGGFILYLK